MTSHLQRLNAPIYPPCISELQKKIQSDLGKDFYGKKSQKLPCNCKIHCLCYPQHPGGCVKLLGILGDFWYDCPGGKMGEVFVPGSGGYVLLQNSKIQWIPGSGKNIEINGRTTWVPDEKSLKNWCDYYRKNTEMFPIMELLIK